MKKLILGLLLTVGISGVSFAKEIDKKNENYDFDKLINYTNNDLSMKTQNYDLLSCTIATHVRMYDECGSLLMTVKTSEEASGEACGGNEGGIIINVSNYYGMTNSGCAKLKFLEEAINWLLN